MITHDYIELWSYVNNLKTPRKYLVFTIAKTPTEEK